MGGASGGKKGKAAAWRRDIADVAQALDAGEPGQPQALFWFLLSER